MKYDFETLVDRSHCGSGKWDAMRQLKPDLSPGVVPLSVADMEFKNAPEIAQGLKAYMDQNILGYTSPTREYRETVCAWMETRHNWHIEPQWIVGTHGVVEALMFAVKAFCQPGDGVIIFTPVYYPFYMAIENHGCQVVRCPLVYEDNAYSIDFGLLEQLAAQENNKMLILCSPHNPVGRVWTKEELARLGEICKRHQVLVISDEIHSDIVFSGHSHTPFPLASDAPCILCTAPGKTFNVAGLRASNIFIFDPELKKQYDATCAAYSMPGSSTFGLAAVEAAYSPAGAEWLAQLLAYLEENARLVDRWAKEHHLGFAMPQGCFLCWLDLSPAGLTDQEIQTKIIVGQEVVCVPGPWFGPGGEGHLRLNIGCPRSILEEALRRIALVL